MFHVQSFLKFAAADKTQKKLNGECRYSRFNYLSKYPTDSKFYLNYYL